MHKLESEMIYISKDCYRKVKDVPWTLSKIITSVQELNEKVQSKSTAWVMRGLQNVNKVKCK